jgi:putative ABC transport system substrate-binding protein
MIKGGADALWMKNDLVFNQNSKRIAELALKYRLPAISHRPVFPEAGGLMSYGSSLADMWRRAAALVDKILKGTKPADIPVERPVKFNLIINLKTAKKLGITIPPEVLLRATKVIK